MLSADDLLSKQILFQLFFVVDPRAWRLRQVTQITPITTDSYRARTSYQFRLGRGLIEAAWAEVVAGMPLPLPSRSDSDPELLVPVDYLPKCVLLDFSLQDAAGRPLLLLRSGEISAITLEVVRAGLTFLDQKCGDGSSIAATFFAAHDQLIWALVASGQREIPDRLARLNCFSTATPSQREYCNAMTRFMNDGFRQLLDRPLNAAERDLSWAKLGEIYREIARMEDDLAALVGGGEHYRHPVFNAPLLFVDYARTRDDLHVVPGTVVSNFLDATLNFTRDLLALTTDGQRFLVILRILHRVARYYVAYTRMRVPVDRDFIIKMEQVIPAARDPYSTWRTPINRWRYRDYQWYPHRIGDSQSTHIEVTSEHPLELEQVPGETKVRVAGRVLDASAVFGRPSYETKSHQHFYTNRSGEEIRRLLRLPGERQMFDLHVGVRFRVEPSLRWGYRLIVGVMIVAAIFLVVVYDPDQLTTNETSFLPVVPILFALFGALAALRTQEGIVAARVKGCKFSVIVLGAIMTLYVLVGVVYAPPIRSLRALVADALRQNTAVPISAARSITTRSGW